MTQNHKSHRSCNPKNTSTCSASENHCRFTA